MKEGITMRIFTEEEIEKWIDYTDEEVLPKGQIITNFKDNTSEFIKEYKTVFD